MAKQSIVRGRLVVHGNVQKVGYRAFVNVVAGNLGVDGSVKNLDDRTVEIYYECPPDVFSMFLKALNKKAADPTNPMYINVSRIEKFDDRTKGFDKKRIRRPFEVIYNGKNMGVLEREAMERSELAILAMTSMDQNISTKQDKTLDAIQKMDSNISEKIDKMDSNITQRFDWLAERYGEFGTKLTTMETDMHNIQKDIHEMKDAFVRWVEYSTSEKKK